MPSRNRNRYYSALGGLMAIALTISIPLTSSAQQFSDPLGQLPVQERVALREGQTVVSGNNGQFTGRVLVDASTETTWQVLTDYDNFEQFFPNVESSRLLEVSGNRHVFEQVSMVRVFPINRRVRISIAATETHPQQIQFNLVDGDVESLQGTWELTPIGPYVGATPNQVLITHEVAIAPEGGGITRGIFFSTYRDILEDTLAAIKQETERRTQ